MKRIGKIMAVLLIVAAVAATMLLADGYRAFTNTPVCTGEPEVVRASEQEIAFRYKWSWDGKPHDLGTDLVQIECTAVNPEGEDIDYDSVCSAVVFYRTQDGQIIQDEIRFDGCAEIPMKKKLQNHAGATVSAWAQSGMIEVSVSAPQKHTPLGLLRIHGLYGHQKQGMWIKESEVVLEGQKLQLPEGYTKMAEVQMRLFADGTLKNQ